MIERTVPLRRGLNLGSQAQTVAVVRSQSVDDALRIAEIGNEAKKVAEMVRLRIVRSARSRVRCRKISSGAWRATITRALQVAIELLDQELMRKVAEEFDSRRTTRGDPAATRRELTRAVLLLANATGWSRREILKMPLLDFVRMLQELPEVRRIAAAGFASVFGGNSGA